MAIWKLVWHFSQRPGITFNEVHHCIQTTRNDVIALNAGNEMIYTRLRFLEDTAKLETIYISEQGILGPGQPVPVNRHGLEGGSASTNAYHPDAACVVNLVSTDVPGRRKIWLRGMSSKWIFRDPVTNEASLTGEGQSLLGEWLTVYTGQGMNHIVNKRGVGGAIGDALVALVNKVAQHGPNPAPNSRLYMSSAGWVDNVLVNDTIVVFSVLDRALVGLPGAYKVIAKGSDDGGPYVVVNYRMPTGLVSVTASGVARAYRAVTAEGAIIVMPPSRFAYIGTRRSKNIATGSRGARRRVKSRK